MWFSFKWIVARRLGLEWVEQETPTLIMNPPLNVENS
jgi:hypothetical protein